MVVLFVLSAHPLRWLSSDGLFSRNAKTPLPVKVRGDVAKIATIGFLLVYVLDASHLASLRSCLCCI